MTWLAVLGLIGVGYLIGTFLPLYIASQMEPVDIGEIELDECACGVFDMSPGSTIRFQGIAHGSEVCAWE